MGRTNSGRSNKELSTNKKAISNRLRKAKALASGLCKDCRRFPRHNQLTRCHTCQLKELASYHLRSASRWTELNTLLVRQQNRCAYSGRGIDIGKNASIEHVEPISKNEGRRTDIRNIKWVDLEVNRMKSNLPLHDFLMLCKDILSYFGYEVMKDGSK